MGRPTQSGPNQLHTLSRCPIPVHVIHRVAVLETTHYQTARRDDDLQALGVSPTNVDMVEKYLGAYPIKNLANEIIMGLKFGLNFITMGLVCH